jgi:FeS assembly SUF system protein
MSGSSIRIPPITGDTPEEQVVSALRSVYDPEIPVNIYDLGLIYRVDIRDGRHVAIQMTLTAPACPVAGSMPAAVERAVKRVPGIESAAVELVWDPPWTQDRMSDEARLELGLM